MRNLAYDQGIERAFAEAGYASLREFVKHGSSLAEDLNRIPRSEFLSNMEELSREMPDMAEKIRSLHEDSSRGVMKEVDKLKPRGGGLLDKIRGVFSAEPHVPEKAQWFLNEANHGMPSHEVIQVGSGPGEFVVKRFEMGNIPTHQEAAVHLSKDVLHGPEAEQVAANIRSGMVPKWVGGGGLLGAAAGVGIGHLATPDNADDKEHERRMIMGGTLGAGVGAVGGGLLGYLRGGALGRATIAGKDLAQQAGQAFGR
jgi:hypothetical protein